MRSSSGFSSDGPARQYDCQTCALLTDETYEDTPLHICSGGLDDGEYDYPIERYRYIRQCLDEGEPVNMDVLTLLEHGFLEQEFEAAVLKIYTPRETLVIPDYSIIKSWMKESA